MRALQRKLLVSRTTKRLTIVGYNARHPRLRYFERTVEQVKPLYGCLTVHLPLPFSMPDLRLRYEGATVKVLERKTISYQGGKVDYPAALRQYIELAREVATAWRLEENYQRGPHRIVVTDMLEADGHRVWSPASTSHHPDGYVVIQEPLFGVLSAMQRFFILLHEGCHLMTGSRDEEACDRFAGRICAEQGYSLQECLNAMEAMFLAYPASDSLQDQWATRMERLYHFLLQYENHNWRAALQISKACHQQ